MGKVCTVHVKVLVVKLLALSIRIQEVLSFTFGSFLTDYENDPVVHNADEKDKNGLFCLRLEFLDHPVQLSYLLHCLVHQAK